MTVSARRGCKLNAAAKARTRPGFREVQELVFIRNQVARAKVTSGFVDAELVLISSHVGRIKSKIFLLSGITYSCGDLGEGGEALQNRRCAEPL